MSSAVSCGRRSCMDARDRHERGEITPAEFKAVEDRAVDEAVALQEAAGLDVVTDGEMRRLRVLRSPGRRARRVRQVRRLVDHASATTQGHEAPLAAAGRRRQAALAAADERRGVHLPARADDEGRSRSRSLSAQQAAAYYDPDKSKARVRDARRLSRGPRRLHAARDRRSCSASGATTSRSTRRSTRRCSTRRSAKATASAAAIPTRCSTRASSSTTRSSTGTPASRSASTSAAATTRACSTRQAATTGSREQVFSPRRTSIASCSSTTTSGRARSSRCGYVPDDRVVVLGLVSSKTPRLESEDDAARAHRRSRADRAARTAGAQPAVRLRLHPRRQPTVSPDDQRRKLELVRARRQRCGRRHLSGWGQLAPPGPRPGPFAPRPRCGGFTVANASTGLPAAHAIPRRSIGWTCGFVKLT